MRLKATYEKRLDGWAFVISNCKTRTVSEGYRTKKQSIEVVREIIKGVKNNNKT